MNSFRFSSFLFPALLIQHAVAGGKAPPPPPPSTGLPIVISTPKVSVGIEAEGFSENKLEGLSPTVEWETSGYIPNVCGFEGGLSLTVEGEGDMPYSVWGKVKSHTDAGIKYSARVGYDSGEEGFVDFGLYGATLDGNTEIHFSGVADAKKRSVSMENIRLSQTVVEGGGSFLKVMPRYHVPSQRGDLKVSYGVGDTTISVESDLEKRVVTIDQRIDSVGGTFSPSVTTNGDVQLEYSHDIGIGTLTASYTPGETVGLTYEDDSMIANVNLPVEGFYKADIESLRFSIRRIVESTDD